MPIGLLTPTLNAHTAAPNVVSWSLRQTVTSLLLYYPHLNLNSLNLNFKLVFLLCLATALSH